jgi:hypothetical protein
MKFRFVLLEPDDEADKHQLGHKNAEWPLPSSSSLWYEQRDDVMTCVRRNESGSLRSTTVANFTARITRDVILSDGEGETRCLEIEARLGGQIVRTNVSVVEFTRTSWVLNKLDPEAIIYP